MRDVWRLGALLNLILLAYAKPGGKLMEFMCDMVRVYLRFPGLTIRCPSWPQSAAPFEFSWTRTLRQTWMMSELSACSMRSQTWASWKSLG